MIGNTFTRSKFMNLAPSVNSFNFFASCYIYGCLTYISVLLLIHIYCSLLADYKAENQSVQTIESDFYTQVKDLFSTTEKSSFESMTLLELRTHVRENNLHQHIRDRLNKTVSNAHKSELVRALS